MGRVSTASRAGYLVAASVRGLTGDRNGHRSSRMSPDIEHGADGDTTQYSLRGSVRRAVAAGDASAPRHSIPHPSHGSPGGPFVPTLTPLRDARRVHVEPHDPRRAV